MASISNTSTIGKMSDRAEVKLTILEAVVKGYHECSFAVRLGDKFVYLEVIRTLVALVVTILYTLHTVACVQIQLQWSFSSYLSEALATAV